MSDNSIIGFSFAQYGPFTLTDTGQGASLSWTAGPNFNPQTFVCEFGITNGQLSTTRLPDGTLRVTLNLSYEDYNRLIASHPNIYHGLPLMATDTGRAQIQPNDWPQPGPIGNTQGIIVPQTSCALPGQPTRPPVTGKTPEQKHFLKVVHKSLKDDKEDIDNYIDDWVEKEGNSEPAKITGAMGKALNEFFFPQHWWELIPVSKIGKIPKAVRAIKELKKLTEAEKEAARLKREADEAARLRKIEEEERLAQEAGKPKPTPKPTPKGKGKGKGGSVKGTEKPTKEPPPNKPKRMEPGPCDDLKRGQGKGKYRGGAHSQTTKPKNDKLDSHHMPTKDESPLHKDDGPAIQMEEWDHQETSSNGSGPKQIQFREEIGELIKAGKWDEVMKKEIEDVQRVARVAGYPTRYDEAIQEMMAYFNCLKKHGLLPKP